jgi:hypothetical protein
MLFGAGTSLVPKKAKLKLWLLVTKELSTEKR